MDAIEKKKMIEETLKQAEQHEEAMRLSYVIARQRTETVRRELELCEGS